MPNSKSILSGIKKITEDRLGALDGATPYLCRHAYHRSLSDILAGDVECWDWITISANEAEDLKIITIVFVNFIDQSTAYNYNTIVNSNQKTVVLASAVGLMINDYVFLNDNYKTTDFKFDLRSSDIVRFDHLNQEVSDYVVRATFDLENCSYYCRL